MIRQNFSQRSCAGIGARLRCGCWKRPGTPAQSGLTSAEQRRANVLGVYEAVNRETFAGKRVLLVDDILTTGSTVQEAARVLKLAGAAEVTVLTLAAAREEKRT